MAEKQLNVRLQQKTDTSANWALAVNFIPKSGEIIVYSDLHKIKIGDGVTTVSSLPFSAQDYEKPSGGIPLNDLSVEVQTSIGKADTALQSHQSVALASGTNNGTLKITTAAGTTDNVAVTGLGSAAYTVSAAYATAAQGAKADTALQPKTLVKDTSSTSVTVTANGNTNYIYGELTALNLSFTTGVDEAEIDVMFKSGATATTLTVSTTNAVFKSFVPSANAYIEINAKWYIDKWIVLFNEVSAS